MASNGIFVQPELDLEASALHGLTQLPTLPAKNTNVTWGNLVGSSLGLVIAQTTRTHNSPVVVVTTDMSQTMQLYRETGYYLQSQQYRAPRYIFPDWETLPYDLFSPHQDIISNRLQALYHLPNLTQGILFLPISTLLQFIAPQTFLDQNSFMLKQGEQFDLEAMCKRLESSGYQRVSQVFEHGEFAVRGSLMDLFPMGSSLPYRIDLFDNEVESIRTFDPENQRSLETIPAIELLPAKEYPTTEEGITQFRKNYRANFTGDPMTSVIYREVSEGNSPPGIEYYLPLFFEKTQSLFDYLPKQTLFIRTDQIHSSAKHFWDEVQERYEQRRHDIERLPLPPEKLYLLPEHLEQRCQQHPQILLQQARCLPSTVTKSISVDYATQALPNIALDQHGHPPSTKLTQFVAEFQGRILFSAETTGRREVLLELLHGCKLHPTTFQHWDEFLTSEQRLGITIAPLERGMILKDPALAIITETQIFGERAQQRRRRKKTAKDGAQIIRDLAELAIDAPVVHEDHGVGRYLGLQRIEIGEQENEFLTLEYAGGDKLYVPVASLHLISRYSGAENAPLHRLGTDQWQRAKRKAAERVRDVAAELLDVYARRAARKGRSFIIDAQEYNAFASAFPFEETADQHDSINAVMEDLQSDQPMDRVVCGDVGFGKTEVAMRAAFIAAHCNTQVAVLVPTTLLAQQHYQNFCDRFADWPFHIEVLSRFRTKKEQTEALMQLREGKIDIIIGTHKLIQKDVHFKNLGLVIVDEEHRFGVRQKERFKSLRAEVDMLTLTATPIPRTLNMSLSGLRDLSIIATPPQQRLSIKTFVSEWNKTLIQEGCLREIKRGGQVYFLHNQVDTIERTARELRALIPEAKIEIAHGQMREKELEQTMLDFYHQRFNLLVCSTIIESGIDVPNANTIIINRADKLGLAQLHQLRGRVGRSHRRAYAYLITPNRRAMSADAVKRVTAIESLETLGAGFTLATHDLEIRGAGELLGDGQSGQINEIGYTLYTELLERAVKAIRSGKQPELDTPLDHGPEVDLGVPALLPESFLPDVHTRLTIYKRIASAPDQEALKDLQVEMIDRFGLLPEYAKNLFAVTELKLRAAPLGIRKIEVGAKAGRVVFNHEPNIDPNQVIKLLQTKPNVYRLDGNDVLRFTMDLDTQQQRAEAVIRLLDCLGIKDAA